MVVSQTQIKPLSLSELGKRFEGKVAIVTASTQGIGFAIAHRLGLEGASVVISSRKQVQLISCFQSLFLWSLGQSLHLFLLVLEKKILVLYLGYKN